MSLLLGFVSYSSVDAKKNAKVNCVP